MKIALTLGLCFVTVYIICVGIIHYCALPPKTTDTPISSQIKGTPHVYRQEIRLDNKILDSYEEHKLNGIISFEKDWKDNFINEKFKSFQFSQLTNNTFISAGHGKSVFGIVWDDEDVAIQNMLITLEAFKYKYKTYIVSKERLHIDSICFYSDCFHIKTTDPAIKRLTNPIFLKYRPNGSRIIYTVSEFKDYISIHPSQDDRKNLLDLALNFLHAFDEEILN